MGCGGGLGLGLDDGPVPARPEARIRWDGKYVCGVEDATIAMGL